MRFFRRLGGAVRSAVSGGLARLTKPGGPAAPRSSGKTAAPRDPAAPCNPRRPRVASPPSADAPAASPRPARRGWFARWFVRKPPHSAAPADSEQPSRKPRARRKKDPLFTPETHPGLTAEDCAFLNTPLGECSPDQLRLVAAALSHQIAAAMGARLGMDEDTLFATFCERLFVTPGTEAAEAPLADVPSALEDTDPPTSALHQTQDRDSSENSAAALAPVARAAAAPALYGSQLPRQRRRWFRLQFMLPGRRGCARLTHRLRGASLSLLPPRRFCYAACAGPP